MYCIIRMYTQKTDFVDEILLLTVKSILPSIDLIIDIHAHETKNYVALMTRNTTIRYLKAQAVNDTSQDKGGDELTAPPSS